MLRVMVPVAVAFEMTNGEAQAERLSSQHPSRAGSRADSSEDRGSQASNESGYVDRRYGNGNS
jgi:hypothetical protein